VGITVVAPLTPDETRSVGPYLLLGQLGHDGLGQVFLGRSPGGETVTVRVIRTELAADPSFRTRFRAEVTAAEKVRGAFVTPVVDADLDGDVPWLAMAHAGSPSLAEAVRDRGSLPVRSQLRLAADLAEGLAAIHAAGVVHHNLNPSNVLLAGDGARVTDFGIWQAAAESALPGADPGWLGFSPGFLSPEQALGYDAEPPSDIFSLGAVLTFAGTGQGPFGSGTSAALVYRLVNSPADLGGLPDELRPLVTACLAKQPDERPTASRLLAELRAVQSRAGALPGQIGSGGSGPGATEPVPAWPVASSSAGATVPTPAGAVAPTSAGAPRAVAGAAAVAGAGAAAVASAGAVAAASAGAAAAGAAADEPRPGSGRGGRGRRRHRRSRPSAPPWIAGGVLAASGAVVVFLTGVVPSSSTGQGHSQAGAAVAGPASTSQAPQIAGSSPSAPSGSSPSGHSDPVTPSVLQGPSSSSFLNPTASSSVPPNGSTSASSAPSKSASPSKSPSKSASPSKSPSKSASPSPSPSKSASPSPSPSKSASPSPSPSKSASSSPSPSSSPSSASSSPSSSSSSPSQSAAAPSSSAASPSASGTSG
jgi:eukaryotic-like serine/threonine-protein kinase